MIQITLRSFQQVKFQKWHVISMIRSFKSKALTDKASATDENTVDGSSAVVTDIDYADKEHDSLQSSNLARGVFV
jgi:hypothetical protein